MNWLILIKSVGLVLIGWIYKVEGGPEILVINSIDPGANIGGYQIYYVG